MNISKPTPADMKRVVKYHVIFSNKLWKFKREKRNKSIHTCKDKSTLMTEAIYYLANNGGYCYVHKEDGSVDFLLSNWFAGK